MFEGGLAELHTHLGGSVASEILWSIAHEQGISKAGNRRLRKTMVELAWSWTHHQPGSALTQWFQKKTAGQGKRAKRIAIVALARKLLLALWRYLDDGVVPQGAVVKTP